MSDRSRREFLAIGGATAIGGLAGRLGGSEGLSGRVTIGGRTTPLLADVTERFRRVHPGVTVSIGEPDAGIDGKPDVRYANRPLSATDRDAASDGEYASLGSAPESLAVLTGSGWHRRLDGDRQAELRADGRNVETWTEVDPDGIDGAIGTLGTDVPGAGTTVLARGVRRHQYAIGHGGIGYYEANPADLRPAVASSDDLAAGTPLARLRFGYVDRAALERPEVEAFARRYVAAAESLAADLDYVAVPDGA